MGTFMEGREVVGTNGGGGCLGLDGNPGGDVGLGDCGDSGDGLLVIDDDMETPGLVSCLGGVTDIQEETSSCSPRSRASIAWPAIA